LVRELVAAVLFVSLPLLASGCSSGTAAKRAAPTSSGTTTTASVASATGQPTTTEAEFDQLTGGPQAFGGVAEGSVCPSSDLRLRFGGSVSEATGQHSLGLLLVNTGAAICHLDGYPRVALLDTAGRVLPFTYRFGGDQMITSQPPGVVNILPGGAGYVLTNKYRCDLGDKAAPASVTVTPPGNHSTLSLTLGPRQDMTFCGAGDPGSTLDISPVAPDARATFAV
jgi:hypothetical protein